jgi:ribosomal RNA-processing protein 36
LAGEKKELLLKARYEELASTGGKRAVKKAIEKKQKKLSQKEKKSRPFARGEGSNAYNTGSGGDRPTKRRRTG